MKSEPRPFALLHALWKCTGRFTAGGDGIADFPLRFYCATRTGREIEKVCYKNSPRGTDISYMKQLRSCKSSVLVVAPFSAYETHEDCLLTLDLLFYCVIIAAQSTWGLGASRSLLDGFRSSNSVCKTLLQSTST